MGHIVNPNIYRLGKMLPWVSSGFKRKKNERSKIANEDFLIYNFTRNFFYKKVYKKVIGKIIKAKLKVRKRKQLVRKNKRKRKFGKTSLLNHWIIKYSHLTITRFSKTFQLNLFFFDRELQKKYRLRYKRRLKKIKKRHLIRKNKKIKILKKALESTLKRNTKRIKALTTKVHFNGIAHNFQVQRTKNVITPTLSGLSKEMAYDIRSIIKKPREDKMNYSIARDFRKKGDLREKIYIYKDNTFEGNKIKDRLTQSINSTNQNENYKSIYFNKTIKKLYYRRKFKKYSLNYFLPNEYTYVDATYFKKQARASNKYLYYKGLSGLKNIGLNNQLAYNYKKTYLDTIRKKDTKNLNIISNNIQIIKNIKMQQVIKNFEKRIEKLKLKEAVRKVKRKDVIKQLKQKELWKKHYLRLKIKVKFRKRKRFKIKHRSAMNFAKRIIRKNKRIN